MVKQKKGFQKRLPSPFRFLLILIVIALLVVGFGYCYSVAAWSGGSCTAIVTTLFAMSTESTSVCASIEDTADKDTCYWNVAINERDSALCEKIDYALLKADCQVQIAIHTDESPVACEQLRKNLLEDKENCYRQQNIPNPAPTQMQWHLKTSIGSCEDKENDGVRGIRDCYQAFAEQSNDLEVCNALAELSPTDVESCKFDAENAIAFYAQQR